MIKHVIMFNLGQLVGNSQSLICAITRIKDFILGSSSETLRESLKKLSMHESKHRKPKSDYDFGYYLADLIEINGHFNKQNKLIIPFHLKYIKLIYFKSH
jgi:hypothetical protein